MCKYYKWWFFLNQVYEIAEENINSYDTFFKFCYEPAIECEIGQRSFNGIYDNIYYYNGSLDRISAYHEKTYGNEGSFRLIKKISEASVVEETYKNFKLCAFNVFNFDDKYEVRTHCIFNAEYKMQQYTEYYYDEKGEISKEKVFIPAVWKIHEESAE